MGKDKRKDLQVHVHGFRGDVVVEYTDGSRNIFNISRTPPIMTLHTPTSYEEIVMQLDIRGIKWKTIVFTDHRLRRGSYYRNRNFQGDTIIISKNDMKDIEKFDKDIKRINASILNQMPNALFS